MKLIHRDGRWHLWASCHPLDDPLQTDQMTTEYATSTDGLAWSAHIAFDRSLGFGLRTRDGFQRA